jgi:pyruvate, orthophosphate dikinase
LAAQVNDGIKAIEKIVGRQFGDAKNPLLVSVRSGARASMPGMMDTILNLGLNDETVEGLALKTGNARFAYDSYRRFIQMYSDVVLGVDHDVFEDLLDLMKNERDFSQDTDLSADDLKELVAQYKERVAKHIKRPFPQDVHEQLWGAIRAVFDSWMNPRAITYRNLHDIPAEWGGQRIQIRRGFGRNLECSHQCFFGRGGEFIRKACGEGSLRFLLFRSQDVHCALDSGKGGGFKCGG